jgi:transcriptional regulator with XRE-family HTH domain
MAIGQRIKEARARRGVSQEKLAAKIHTGQTTISSWERGRTEPTREDVQRVADALELDVAELELVDAPTRTRQYVPLVGYVGAGAAAHYYASADEGLGEVEAPDDATDNTVAVEVRGESLGALFESWLVFYDDVRSPVTPDLYNRLCVVGLPDGKVLVKRIRKARTEGLFHLDSNTEPTMNDQEIVWAARVKTMRPR